jgi:hypothetical protein
MSANSGLANLARLGQRSGLGWAVSAGDAAVMPRRAVYCATVTVRVGLFKLPVLANALPARAS